MSAVSDEILSQPECWRRAADLGAEDAGTTLPLPGERVIAVGCGTSYYIAQAYAALRESADLGLTDAFPASEVPPNRRYDRILVLSRSGTTTEVLDLLAEVDGVLPSLAITADPAAPLAATATESVVLDFADEQSVVQTRFATTALALLRAHLGESLDAAIKDAATAVDAPLPAGALERSQVTYLGRGWTVGLANEAALKLREAAGMWSESYPAMEYRHGPISIADENVLVWAFGDVPDGLAQQVTDTGASFEHSDVDPMADLIRAQRLAVEWARARQLDPDAPRNLTRSVILSG